MQNNLRKQLETYIEDWHYDMETYKSSLNIGKFMFAFMNFLDDEKISEKTQSKHEQNLYLIGMFESEYAYNNDFDAEDLELTESYEEEFKRKIAYSKSNLKFYQTTWKKLGKYVSSGLYKKYLDEFEEEYQDLGYANDVIDFVQKTLYLEISDSEIAKKLKHNTKIIEDNYIEFEECETKKEYNDSILKSWKATETVYELIEASGIEKNTKNEILKEAEELIHAFYALVNN